MVMTVMTRRKLKILSLFLPPGHFPFRGLWTAALGGQSRFFSAEEFFFPSTRDVLEIMGIFILSWEFKDGVAVTSQRRLVTPSNPYFY